MFQHLSARVWFGSRTSAPNGQPSGWSRRPATNGRCGRPVPAVGVAYTTPREHAAMRRRPHHVSSLERAASFAAASGVTAATALLVLVALVPRLGTRPEPAPIGVRPAPERVVFVASPTSPPPVVATRQTPRPPARPASVVRSLQQEPNTASPPYTAPAMAARAARREPDANATNAATASTVSAQPAPAGAPAASASVGFRLPSSPIRVDSALRAMTDSVRNGLAAGLLHPPPLTQAETDAKWRAEAFEVAAARGAGEPVRRTMAGGSIPVPLPFGGPSRKRRERDRAIEAQLAVMRALRQARADSAVAARRRRHSDSVAPVADSLDR